MRQYHILIIVFFAASCQDNSKEKAEGQVPIVEVIQPGTAAYKNLTSSTGSIGNSEEILLSFKTGGMVEQVNKHLGDYVKKGELLAKLNTTELDAQLRQANLDIQKLSRDESRISELVKDTIATFEQLQNIQTALSIANEQKRIIEFNKKQAYLYAPHDGYILKQLINVGEFKAPASLAFAIGSNSNLERWVFRSGFSDKDRVLLFKGQQAIITLDVLPGKEFNGTIVKLMEIPDQHTGTYDCYVSFDPGDENIVYGLTGKLSITHQSVKPYTVLPLESLSAMQGNEAVIFTLSADSIVQKQDIHVLGINGKDVFIEEVLPRDLWVITTGRSYVVPGQKVKVKA